MLRRSLWIESACLALVIIAVCLRYAPATRLSWTYDDAFLLRVVKTSDVPGYFASAKFWRSMPSNMFVPLLLVWYEAGSRAGGEAGFYALALVLLAIALAASYVALRQWLGAVESLAAVAMIGLGPPVVSLVTQLMATHYLLALALCAMAIASLRWPVLSALFYLLAMLAKEVAVPLPAFLLLLPRTRPRTLIPHGIALVAYFAWRKWMIGTFLGGYGWAVTRENAGALLRSLPGQIWNAMTPPNAPIAIALALVILAPIVWGVVESSSRRVVKEDLGDSKTRRLGDLWRILIAIALAIAPILPVSREMQPRYVFALWVVLAVLFAIAAQNRVMLCAIAVAIVGLANIAEWNDVEPLAARMSAEARFVRSAPADAMLRLPKTPPAAMGELIAMRGGGVTAFYDDLVLCRGAQRGHRVFQSENNRVVDITPRIDTIARQHCGAIRANVPLRAQFRFDDGVLSWTFGPQTRGSWTILFADGLQAFAVPRADAFRLGNVPSLDLRIRYDAPEGWTAYSPTIHLDLAHR